MGFNTQKRIENLTFWFSSPRFSENSSQFSSDFSPANPVLLLHCQLSLNAQLCDFFPIISLNLCFLLLKNVLPLSPFFLARALSLSQVFGAVCVAWAIEVWRTRENTNESQGEGGVGGCLVSSIVDCALCYLLRLKNLTGYTISGSS